MNRYIKIICVFLLLIVPLVGCASNDIDDNLVISYDSFEGRCSPEALEIISNLSPDKRIEAAILSYNLFCELEWSNKNKLIEGLEKIEGLATAYSLDKENQRIRNDIQSIQTNSWDLTDSASVSKRQESIFKTINYEYFQPLILAVYAEQNQHDNTLPIDAKLLVKTVQDMGYTSIIDDIGDDYIINKYYLPQDIKIEKNGKLKPKSSTSNHISLEYDKHEKLNFIYTTMPLYLGETIPDNEWEGFWGKSGVEQRAIVVDNAVTMLADISILESEKYFKAILDEEEYQSLLIFLKGLTKDDLTKASEIPISETDCAVHFILKYNNKNITIDFLPDKIVGGSVMRNSSEGSSYEKDVEILRTALLERESSSQSSPQQTEFPYGVTVDMNEITNI